MSPRLGCWRGESDSLKRLAQGPPVPPNPVPRFDNRSDRGPISPVRDDRTASENGESTCRRGAFFRPYRDSSFRGVVGPFPHR